MDGKALRQTFSYGFLILYSFYAVFMIGMTGLLFSFAIGLIVLSMGQPIELIVAATILSGLVWKVLTERRRKEGFAGAPVGTGNSAAEITRKIQGMQQKYKAQPTGVLSSNFAEGFADLNSSEQPQNAGSATAKPAGQETPPPAESTAAAVNAPTVSKEMEKAIPVMEEKKEEKAGFSDKATDGMFKLGSIPADAVGGAHIDVGTTLMNALNSLKPDQIKAMTEDTKKLMETQKSLMGMLTTMKPMISDGKELMETFTQMFGKN